jgi:hypothetical protein
VTSRPRRRLAETPSPRRPNLMLDAPRLPRFTVRPGARRVRRRKRQLLAIVVVLLRFELRLNSHGLGAKLLPLSLEEAHRWTDPVSREGDHSSRNSTATIRPLRLRSSQRHPDHWSCPCGRRLDRVERDPWSSASGEAVGTYSTGSVINELCVKARMYETAIAVSRARINETLYASISSARAAASAWSLSEAASRSASCSYSDGSGRTRA